MTNEAAHSTRSIPSGGSTRARPCPERVNVLLIGGGGREHALAWRMAQSGRLGGLWVTHPENPGLAALGQPCEVAVEPKEYWRLAKWCNTHRIDLVVVGPEGPLAEGVTDALATDRRLVFGPTRTAAQLEADKAWAKQLMRSAAVPTAEARIFANYEQAVQYLESRTEMPVIKASGLAAGKGVVLPETVDEGVKTLERIMKHRVFGDAGAQVVIEERLQGPEVSIFALIDGRNIYMLETCQDHKRLLDGDLGPNTGGMGAYSPVNWLDAATLSVVEHEILVPTLDALRREEIEYHGVLYAGLILTPGGPKMLEFNCRFGDPECQVLMARLRSDAIEMLWATAAGRLDEIHIEWDERVACCVVMAAPGYPGPVKKNLPIEGLDEAAALQDVTIFHAGTRRDGGEVVTAGGRVLGVAALGASLADARGRAVQACERIRFEGAQFRRDIGAAGERLARR